MIIKVSDNLKSLEVWANGRNLPSIMGEPSRDANGYIVYPEHKKKHAHTFKNPVLMTDNYQIAQLNPTKRDTLFALYGAKPRIVEYNGVGVFWDDTHINVWCPSIDTILFAKALGRVFREKKNLKAAAEIGCGSGYLSKYVLSKNKRLRSMLINDINPYAIKCAKDNIKDRRANFYVGDGLKRIKNKKFDLLICNPPYIPRPGAQETNPYEGVGLLNHLIHEGRQYLNEGGVLVTNFSNLSRDIVFKNDPAMRMKILEKMRVPLKVNNVLNNKRWLNYLMRRGLKKENRPDYEYWQEINIAAFY